MKFSTKEEYIKILRENSVYSSILKKAKTKEERKKIIDTVEYIAGGLFDAISYSVSSINENPETEKEILEALKTGEGIIKESDGNPIKPSKD